MYDLHTHSLLSDGELLPSELIRRMAVLGYTTVAITDHADKSNISGLIHSIERVQSSAEQYGVKLLTGVEITHVPPNEISALAKMAKKEGAEIVLVHGETPVEPVAPGTNQAACNSEWVDILAHPGLIKRIDAESAIDNHIALEITARGGHNWTNGHIAKIAKELGSTLVINSDSHSPSDLISVDARKVVALGAGIEPAEIEDLLNVKTNLFLKSCFR